MNQQDFDRLSCDLLNTAHEIEAAKRPAYTKGAEDVLANFKQAAQVAGITVGQAVAVLMNKHYDAVVTALTKPEVPQAEQLDGRFADLINYVVLAWAVLKEKP